MNLQSLKNIKYSYYFDEIKKRSTFILGAFLLIFALHLSDFWIIGPIFSHAQKIGLLPNNQGLVLVFRKAIVFAIFAMSWDFLSGYSGQVSFGHALYFGFGAYLIAFIDQGLTIKEIAFGPWKFHNVKIFSPTVNDRQKIFGILMNVNMIKALVLAAFITSILAVLIGGLTLRLKGAYFALVTLVLPLIFNILVGSIWVEYTGLQGVTIGLTPIVVQPETTGDTPGYVIQQRSEFYVFLTILIISTIILYSLARSRVGIALQAIREDELAAASSGINVTYYKLLAILVSSFFAGIAGGLYTQLLTSATPATFETPISFSVIIYTILGGIGSIYGALIGTMILIFAVDVYISNAFINIPTLDLLSFALILILVLRFQPRGLTRSSKRVRNAMFFSVVWIFLLTFRDAKILFSSLSTRYSVQYWLVKEFGKNGLFGLNVAIMEGRVLFYFATGLVLGYFLPDLFRAIRLKIWGVWPSIGNFDPTK